MKTSHRRRRLVTTRVATALGAAALPLAPCAHASLDNQYWRGGPGDNWYSANWDGWPNYEWHTTSLLNASHAYFGSKGYSDHNGKVVANDWVDADSLNFSQQNWWLGFNGGLKVGQINVHWTSPAVSISGNLSGRSTAWNVDTGSVLRILGNVEAHSSLVNLSLDKLGGGTAIIASSTLGSRIDGTNIYGGTLITDNPNDDYNVRGGATIGFNIMSYDEFKSMIDAWCAQLGISVPPNSNYGTRGDLTYSSPIYGAGNFLKTGNATLTMTGSISYTGSTSVEAGRLIFGHNINSYATSSFTFNGGDLELTQLTGNVSYANPINGTDSFTKSGGFNLTLTGNNNHAGGGVFITGGSLIESVPMGQSYTLSNGSNLSFAPFGYRSFGGAITGDGSFTMSGNGIVEFAGVNTYTGGTTVTSGDLYDRHPHGNYVVASGGSLLFPTAYGDLTYAGLVTGSGNFQMNGYNTLTRTANYGDGTSWTGTTTIYNGRLVELHPHGNYTMAADGQLEFANEASLFFGYPDIYTHSGVPGSVAGSGGFTKSGIGDLILNSSSGMTYAGPTTINEGRIVSRVNNALPATTDLTLNGWWSTFLTENGRSQTIASLAGDGSVMLGTGSFTINGSSNTTFSGVISGNGSVVKNGSSTQTLTGVNTYTGDTFITGGRLIETHPHGAYSISEGTDLEFAITSGFAVQNSNAAVTGAGNFTKSGGAILALYEPLAYTGATNVAEGTISSQVTNGLPASTELTVGPAGTFILESGIAQTLTALSGSGTVAIFGPLTINATNYDTFSGVISGSGSLTKRRPGTQILTGVNTYTGGTFVTGGTLVETSSLHGDYTLANGGELEFVIGGTGTFQKNDPGTISGVGSFVKSGTGTLVFTGANTYTGLTYINGGRLVDAQPHGLYTVARGADLEFAPDGSYSPPDGSIIISGFGNFTKSGTGAVIFSAPQTYLGRTTVNEGLLASWVTQGLPATTDLTVNQNGSFYAAGIFGPGYAQTIASLSGSGTVVLGNALTIDGSTDATFSGAISGTTDFFSGAAYGSLVKSGTGTQTLSGENTYTGNTDINSGKLILASGGVLRIKVGANGVSNKLSGSGALDLSGTLVLDLSSAANTPGSSWLLVNTSTLQETYGSTFAIASTQGAFSKHAGKWIRVENGVAYEFDPTTGLLATAIPAGYILWASNHVGGQSADQDFNHDGVANGIAYFMNNTGTITHSGIVGGKVTWPNGGSIAATTYGTEFKVQTSTDLVSWVDISVGDANLTNLAGSVAYTIPTGQARQFVRLMVTPN